MTYKQSNITTPSQTLGLHRDSRTISKIQPKIRIIHMYAPEIINTDVANFRELVQRLTGMPTSVENRPEGTGTGKDKGKDKTSNKKVNPGLLYGSNDVAGRARVNCDKSMVNTKLEVMMMGSSSSSSDHQHDHDDDQGFWRTTAVDLKNTISGGFLTAFSDLDDNFDLSMITMGSADHVSSNNHLNSFGETAQLSFRG